MKVSKALEEYIKTMYILQKQKGIIRVTDIAQKLKKAKPSVNKAIKQLSTKGLATYEAYGKIELTQERRENSTKGP